MEKGKSFAIIPGGYKPPHIGHLDQAKQFADRDDIEKVIVVISPKSRFSENNTIEVTADQSLKIWEIFSKRNPKIKPIISSNPSPVAAVFGMMKKFSKPGDTVYLGTSDKEVEESQQKFKDVSSYVEENDLQIQAKIMTTSTSNIDSGPVSATLMRELISKNDQKQFLNYLPLELNDEEKIAIWNIVSPKNIMFEVKEGEYSLEEISAMAVGAVEGSSARDEEVSEERIDRKTQIEENALRKFIRRTLEKVLVSDPLKIKILEEKIRNITRNILMEQTSSDEVPHSSTGINVLSDLLKKIIPQVEDGYKILTTDVNQRESYKNHILNATQRLLIQADIVGQAGGNIEDVSLEASPDKPDKPDKPSLTEGILRIVDLMNNQMAPVQEIDVNIGEEPEDTNIEKSSDDNGETSKFIDIEGGEKDEKEVDTFGIEGEDLTGRNMAEQVFNKIENQILDSYSVLSNENDKKLFYDYLMANFKLYFEKFEGELESVSSEPEAGDEEAEEASVETEVGTDDALADLEI